MDARRFRRACVALVSVSLLNVSVQQAALAGVVGTVDAVAAARSDDPRAAVDATLARADVRAKLVELGVDPLAVEGRLAALSDQEVASLADRIESAPAGGDALAVIGVVFLVLIILELVGVIDIFKKA
jgi:hypothetical protein